MCDLKVLFKQQGCWIFHLCACFIALIYSNYHPFFTWKTAENLCTIEEYTTHVIFKPLPDFILTYPFDEKSEFEINDDTDAEFGDKFYNGCGEVFTEKDQIGFYDSFEDWNTGYTSASLYVVLACILGSCAGCGICFICFADSTDDCELAEGNEEGSCYSFCVKMCSYAFCCCMCCVIYGIILVNYISSSEADTNLYTLPPPFNEDFQWKDSADFNNKIGLGYYSFHFLFIYFTIVLILSYCGECLGCYTCCPGCIKPLKDTPTFADDYKHSEYIDNDVESYAVLTDNNRGMAVVSERTYSEPIIMNSIIPNSLENNDLNKSRFGKWDANRSSRLGGNKLMLGGDRISAPVYNNDPPPPSYTPYETRGQPNATAPSAPPDYFTAISDNPSVTDNRAELCALCNTAFGLNANFCQKCGRMR